MQTTNQPPQKKIPLTFLLICALLIHNIGHAQPTRLSNVLQYTDSILMHYYYQGKFSEAIPAVEQAVLSLKKEGYCHDSVYIEYAANLALLYSETAAFSKAEKLYLQVRNIADKVYDSKHPTYAMLINNIAVFYEKTGLYEEALKWQLQATQLQEQNVGKQHLDYAISLHNLAFLYLETKALEKAEILFLKAKTIYKKTVGEQSSMYATCLNNLALIYKQKGWHKTAEEFYERSAAIRATVQGKQHPDYTASINNLASLYTKTRQFEQAEELYKKIIQTDAENQGIKHPNYAIDLINLALLYQQTQRYNQAEKLLYEALKIRRLVYGKQHFKVACVLNKIAALSLENGQCEKGYLVVLKALYCNSSNYSCSKPLKHASFLAYQSSSTALESLDISIQCLRKLEQKYRRREYIELQFEIAEKSIQLCSHIVSKLGRDNDKLSAAALSRQFIQIGIEAAAKLNHPNLTKKALAFAEFNKSVLLNDVVNNKKSPLSKILPDSIRTKERLLHLETKALNQHLRSSDSQSVDKRFIDKIAELELDWIRFNQLIKQHFPNYYASKNHQSDVSAEAIKSSLERGTVLLEYFVSDSTIYLFQIDANNCKLHTFPLSKEQLHHKIKALRTALTDYHFITEHPKISTHQYKTTAFELYQLIVQPALKNHDYNKIVVVADEQIGYLPFEALLCQPTNQNKSLNKLSYLIHNYSISYHYSASLLCNTLESNKAYNGQIIGFAAQYNRIDSALLNISFPQKNKLRQSLHQLPQSQQEIKALSANFRGIFLQGRQANEYNFKKNAADYSIIHLAMHGIPDRINPRFSSLAFSEDYKGKEDNFLEAQEIASMQLNAQLVVLSACETGMGKWQPGEGILSLGRSFMYAGVPSVVASLWQVNDASTALLMQFFYQHLAAGKDKAAALRAAKLNYLNQVQGLFAHPVFWAAFVHLGDDQPIYISTRNSRSKRGSVVLIILVFVTTGLGLSKKLLL